MVSDEKWRREGNMMFYLSYIGNLYGQRIGSFHVLDSVALLEYRLDWGADIPRTSREEAGGEGSRRWS